LNQYGKNNLPKACSSGIPTGKPFGRFDKQEAIMSYKRLIMVFLSITICASSIFSDVPPARIHNPNIPYFMESMRFQTMQMNIFSPDVSGMVMDPYSDLV